MRKRLLPIVPDRETRAPLKPPRLPDQTLLPRPEPMVSPEIEPQSRPSAPIQPVRPVLPKLEPIGLPTEPVGPTFKLEPVTVTPARGFASAVDQPKTRDAFLDRYFTYGRSYYSFGSDVVSDYMNVMVNPVIVYAFENWSEDRLNDFHETLLHENAAAFSVDSRIDTIVSDEGSFKTPESIGRARSDIRSVIKTIAASLLGPEIVSSPVEDTETSKSRFEERQKLTTIDPGGYSALKDLLTNLTTKNVTGPIPATEVQEAIALIYDLSSKHLEHFLESFSPDDIQTHQRETALHLRRSLELISLAPPLVSMLEFHNKSASNEYMQNLMRFVLGDPNAKIETDDQSVYEDLSRSAKSKISKQPVRALTIVSAGPGSGKTQSIVDVLSGLINQMREEDAGSFVLGSADKYRFSVAGFNRTTVNEIISKLSRKTNIPPSRDSFEKKVGVSPSTIDSLADRVARGPGLVYITEKNNQYQFSALTPTDNDKKRIETVDDLWRSDLVNPFKVDVKKEISRYLTNEGELTNEANHIAMIHRTTSISPFPHFPYRAQRFKLETLDELAVFGASSDQILKALNDQANRSGSKDHADLAHLIRLMIVHRKAPDKNGRFYSLDDDYKLLSSVIDWLKNAGMLPRSVLVSPAIIYHEQMVARLVIRHLQRFIEYLEVAWGLPIDAIESALNAQNKDAAAFEALIAGLLDQKAGYWSGEYERRAKRTVGLGSIEPLMTLGDFEDYLANDPIHRTMNRGGAQKTGALIKSSIQEAVGFYKIMAIGMSVKALDQHNLAREAFRSLGYTINHLAHSAMIALRTNLVIPNVDNYTKVGSVAQFTDGVTDRPANFLFMDEVQDASSPIFDYHARGAFSLDDKGQPTYRYWLIAIGDSRQQVNRFAGMNHLMAILAKPAYQRLMNEVIHPTDTNAVGRHVIVHKLDASFRNYGDQFTERISRAVKRVMTSWSKHRSDQYERSVQRVRDLIGDPDIPIVRLAHQPRSIRITSDSLEREIKGTTIDPNPDVAKEKVYQFNVEGYGQIQMSVTTGAPIVLKSDHRDAPVAVRVRLSMEIEVAPSDKPERDKRSVPDQLIDAMRSGTLMPESITLAVTVESFDQSGNVRQTSVQRIKGLSPDDFKNRAGLIIRAMQALQDSLVDRSEAIVHIDIQPYPNLITKVVENGAVKTIVLQPVQYQDAIRRVGYIVASSETSESPPKTLFVEPGVVPSKDKNQQLKSEGYSISVFNSDVSPTKLGEMVVPLYQMFAEEFGKIVLYHTGRSIARAIEKHGASKTGHNRSVRIWISGRTAALSSDFSEPIVWKNVFSDSVQNAMQRLADHFSRAVRYVSASSKANLSGMKQIDVPLDELVRIAQDIAFYQSLQSYYYNATGRDPAEETLVVITPTNAEETIIPLIMGVLGIDEPVTTANIHGGVKGATYSRAVWIPPVVQSEGGATSYVATTRGKVRVVEQDDAGFDQTKLLAFKSFTIAPMFSRVRSNVDKNLKGTRGSNLEKIRALALSIDETVRSVTGPVSSQPGPVSAIENRAARLRAPRAPGVYMDPYHSPYFSSAYHHPAPSDPAGVYAFNAYTGDQNAAAEYMGALIQRNLQGGLSTYAVVSSVVGGIVHRKANERRVPKGKRYHSPIQHTVMNLSNINRTDAVVSNRVPSTHGQALKELVNPDGRLMEELVLTGLIVAPIDESGAIVHLDLDASALFRTYQRIAGSDTKLPYSTKDRIEAVSLEPGLKHRSAGVIQLVWGDRSWRAAPNPHHHLAAVELSELAGAENLSAPEIDYVELRRRLITRSQSQDFETSYPALADLIRFVRSLIPSEKPITDELLMDIVIQSVWMGHVCTPPEKNLSVISKERSVEDENAVTELEAFEESDSQELLERALQESDSGTVWANRALVREFIGLRESVRLAENAALTNREDLQALAYQRFEKALDQFISASATHLSSKRAVAQAAKSNPMSYVMAHIATMGGATNTLVSFVDDEQRVWSAPTIDAPIGAVLSDKTMRRKIISGLVDQLTSEEKNYLSSYYSEGEPIGVEEMLENFFKDIESRLNVAWKTRAMGMIDPLLYTLGLVWSIKPDAYHNNQQAIDKLVVEWTRDSLARSRYDLGDLVDGIAQLMGLDDGTTKRLKSDLGPIEFFMNLLGSRVFEGYVARYPLLFNTSALIVPIRLIPMPQLHIPDAYLWAMNGDADGDRAAFMTIGVFKRDDAGHLIARSALAPSLRRLAFMSVVNPIETQENAVYNLTPLAEGNGADPQITTVAFAILDDYDHLRTDEPPQPDEDGFYKLSAELDLKTGQVVWSDRKDQPLSLWSVDESGKTIADRSNSLRAFLIDESYDDLDTNDPQIGVLIKARLNRPGRLWSRYRAETTVRFGKSEYVMPFQTAWFLAGWIRALEPAGEKAQRRFLEIWDKRIGSAITMDAFRDVLIEFLGELDPSERLSTMGALHRFWLLTERAENMPVAPIHFAGYENGALEDFDPETITKKGELVYPEPVRRIVQQKLGQLSGDLSESEASALMIWELLRLVQSDEWYTETNGFHQTVLRVRTEDGSSEWRAYRINKGKTYHFEVYRLSTRDSGSNKGVTDEQLKASVRVEPAGFGFDPTGHESNWQISLTQPLIYEILDQTEISPEMVVKLMEAADYVNPKRYSGLQLVAPKVLDRLKQAETIDDLLVIAQRSGLSQATRIAMGLGVETLYQRAQFDPGVRAVVYKNPIHSTSFNTKRIMAIASNHVRFGQAARLVRAERGLMVVTPSAIGPDYSKQVDLGVAWIPRSTTLHVERNPITYATNRNIESGGIASKVASVSGLAHIVDPSIASDLLAGKTSGDGWRYVGASEPAVTIRFDNQAAFMEWLRDQRMAFNVVIRSKKYAVDLGTISYSDAWRFVSSVPKGAFELVYTPEPIIEYDQPALTGPLSKRALVSSKAYHFGSEEPFVPLIEAVQMTQLNAKSQEKIDAVKRPGSNLFVQPDLIDPIYEGEEEQIGFMTVPGNKVAPMVDVQTDRFHMPLSDYQIEQQGVPLFGVGGRYATEFVLPHTPLVWVNPQWAEPTNKPSLEALLAQIDPAGPRRARNVLRPAYRDRTIVALSTSTIFAMIVDYMNQKSGRSPVSEEDADQILESILKGETYYELELVQDGRLFSSDLTRFIQSKLESIVDRATRFGLTSGDRKLVFVITPDLSKQVDLSGASDRSWYKIAVDTFTALNSSLDNHEYQPIESVVDASVARAAYRAMDTVSRYKEPYIYSDRRVLSASLKMAADLALCESGSAVTPFDKCGLPMTNIYSYKNWSGFELKTAAQGVGQERWADGLVLGYLANRIGFYRTKEGEPSLYERYESNLRQLRRRSMPMVEPRGATWLVIDQLISGDGSHELIGIHSPLFYRSLASGLTGRPIERFYREPLMAPKPEAKTIDIPDLLYPKIAGLRAPVSQQIYGIVRETMKESSVASRNDFRSIVPNAYFFSPDNKTVYQTLGGSVRKLDLKTSAFELSKPSPREHFLWLRQFRHKMGEDLQGQSHTQIDLKWADLRADPQNKLKEIYEKSVAPQLVTDRRAIEEGKRLPYPIRLKIRLTGIRSRKRALGIAQTLMDWISRDLANAESDSLPAVEIVTIVSEPDA